MSSRKTPDLGEVYVAKVGGKDRPVVVASIMPLNGGSTVLVAACTTQKLDSRKRRRQYVSIPKGSFGFWADCVIQFDTILAVDKAKLGKLIGKLDEQKSVEMKRAIAYVSGIEPGDLEPQ